MLFSPLFRFFFCHLPRHGRSLFFRSLFFWHTKHSIHTCIFKQARRGCGLGVVLFGLTKLDGLVISCVLDLVCVCGVLLFPLVVGLSWIFLDSWTRRQQKQDGGGYFHSHTRTTNKRQAHAHHTTRTPKADRTLPHRVARHHMRRLSAAASRQRKRCAGQRRRRRDARNPKLRERSCLLVFI